MQMLFKIALRNVKRQIGNYLIYFVTVSFTVAMLFSVNNLIFSENMRRITAANEDTKRALIGAVIFISIIVAFVLSYATNFMMRLRKQEFGAYLTLGMTRGNILSIFLSETLIIGGFALGAGLAFGLFFFQGLCALFMKLMEMEFSLSAYAKEGLLLTVFLVAGMFSIASVTSAVYLKRTSIYDLIHGKNRERKHKHTALWLLITLASFILIIMSLLYMENAPDKNIAKEDASYGIGNAIFALSVGIIFFHIGLSRCLIHLLLKKKRLRSKGTNIFVLRALSETLGANSIMLGFLAFLLTFSVFGVNISFIQKASLKEELNKNYPYDILYKGDAGFSSEIPAKKAKRIIKKYAKIKSMHSYRFYTNGGGVFRERTQWSGYEGMDDSFLKVSDFNKLIVPLGYQKVKLKNQYMIVSNTPAAAVNNWDGLVFKHGKKNYSLHSVHDDYPKFSYYYFYIVVPDKVTADMEPQTTCAVYDLADGKSDTKFDIKSNIKKLKKELSLPSGRCNYEFREAGRIEQNSVSAILVIGSLFAAMAFLFLAMAILALKTLSGLSFDRQRYAVLFRLGAGAGIQKRTLFRQTFSFFAFPFVVPLIMGIPATLICERFVKAFRMDALSAQIPYIALATAVAMTLVYLLYYIITYRVAALTVVRRAAL